MQINDLKQRITQVLTAHAPQLLDHYGVGPDTASVLLIAAGDNPERLHSEASFAALCGVSPVEASSGKTQRRRLNRGGDRQANSALYSIVLSRLRWDTRSRNYIQRRIAEGKTNREAIRCLTPTETPGVAADNVLGCFVRDRPQVCGARLPGS